MAFEPASASVDDPPPADRAMNVTTSNPVSPEAFPAEAHLCVVGPSAHGSARSLHRFFERVGAWLEQRSLGVLTERLHGPASERHRVLSIRAEALSRSCSGEPWPCSYQYGRESDHLGTVGVQLWAAPRASARTLRTVQAAGLAGRLVETPEARVLWLAAVDGRDDGGRLPEGRARQAERMFVRADQALTQWGFRYGHVVRTWIQLREILDWYGSFNDVRSRFYRLRGIGTARESGPCPASTGVQGGASDEHCVMDLLAVCPNEGGTSVDWVQSSDAQCDARAYGSSFSRAVRLGTSTASTLLVSGTASIGRDGRTLHLDDAEAQAHQSLRSVAAILASRGGGWQDVVASTLYAKDRDAVRAFDRVVHRLGIDSLPRIVVLADLCRPDLLLELDAVARWPASRSSSERRAPSAGGPTEPRAVAGRRQP